MFTHDQEYSFYNLKKKDRNNNEEKKSNNNEEKKKKPASSANPGGEGVGRSLFSEL